MLLFNVAALDFALAGLVWIAVRLRLRRHVLRAVAAPVLAEFPFDAGAVEVLVVVRTTLSSAVITTRNGANPRAGLAFTLMDGFFF
jgi:hypothetical protein